MSKCCRDIGQEYITALSSTDTLNKKATEPKTDITEMPGKCVSNEDFQGNLSGEHNNTSEKLYYRTDALHSTNLFDIKKLLEKTMTEYGSYKLKYVEQSEYHPMTSFFFLTSHTPSSNEPPTNF